MFNYTEIGIDLGEYEIKIARVKELKDESNQDFNQLSNYESYPVFSEMYSQEYFKTLKKAIKDFSKKIGKPNLSLNIVLPINDYSTVSFLNVPAVSEKDLNEGIKFEAEQLFPDKDSSDYQSVWKVINEYEELNEYEIMLATLGAKVIKEISQFKTLKWKVNRIMLAPVILERFAKENEVIVNFGYRHTRLYMYKEGSLNKVETLSTGGLHIEDEVKKYVEENELDLDYKELVNEIHFHNDLIEEDDLLVAISKEVKPTMKSLLEEIKMNIRSFELQNGINIEDVLYMGGLSNLKYLNTALESELEMNVQPMNIVAKDFEDVKYDLAALAMISPELKDKMDFSKFIKMNIDYPSILTAALTVSFSLALTLGIMDNKYNNILEEQNSILSEQTQTMKIIEEDINELDMQIVKNEEFINKIEGLKHQKNWLSDALYLIPETTPLSVSVSRINVVNGMIELEGYSADYSAIGFFAKELETIGSTKIVNVEDFDKNEQVYSVTTSTPESISDKYLMKKKFKMIVNHAGNLMTH